MGFSIWLQPDVCLYFLVLKKFLFGLYFIPQQYVNPQPNSRQAHWNTEMSRVCETVEWGFQYVIVVWRFIDDESSMKIFLTPVAKFYIVSDFLTNARTTY